MELKDIEGVNEKFAESFQDLCRDHKIPIALVVYGNKEFEGKPITGATFYHKAIPMSPDSFGAIDIFKVSSMSVPYAKKLRSSSLMLSEDIT